jgi:HlyD family secretion protein
VQVQPLIDGQAVEELLADIGDWVEAGQALALLSGSTFELQMSELRAQGASVEASIAQAEASLIEAQTAAAEAERVEARNIALRAQGTISAAAAEQAEAAADAARARVRVSEQGIVSATAQRELVDAQMATLELQRDRTEVKSPVTGMIVARNAQVGAIASGQGTPMFTVIRDGALEMRAEVSEADLLRLAPGQRATMASVGGTAPITGTIRMIAPSIDTGTRLGDARIAIDTPDAVRQGMFLTAEVLVSEAEQLAVPVSAVGASAEGATVMLVVDGVVRRVPVVTGIRDGGMIGIVSGLTAGDQIVTRAAAFVRDGDRINPIPDADLAMSEEG